MTSSLYRMSKSSVCHTTPSDDALSVSSECSGEADCLSYSPPPLNDSSKRVPFNFFNQVQHELNDFDFFKAKAELFKNSLKNTYALTVSPQSTPLMKNKKPLQQVEILRRVVSEACDKFDASYLCYFEFYSNMTDIHLHGFLIVRLVKDIDEIKRHIRSALYRGNLPKDRIRLQVPVKVTPQKEISYRTGWIDYCLKDCAFMIKNNIIPFYKIRH